MAFHSDFHIARTSFVTAKIQAIIISMNYDRGLSTILRVVVVVQPQPMVLCMLATHPSSQDYQRASGLSSEDDDVLGHAAN
jgi:hypothetical protein